MAFREKVSPVVTKITGNPALAAWPVNSIFFGYTSTSPATLLGGGTWVQISQGRVLVGQDPSNAAFDTLGDTGGAQTVTLTAAQMPIHSHNMDHDHDSISKTVQYAQTTSTGGTAYRVTDIAGAVGGGGTGVVVTWNIGTRTKDTGNAGSGSAHENMPPFLTVYIWRRTA